MIKYRWFFKDPNIKFSNRLRPQPTLQDTADELTSRCVTGIWLRKVGENWYTIIAWSDPGTLFAGHNPTYGILRDDGILIGPMWDDWAYRVVHGYSRYETHRYKVGGDWRGIYGTSGK